MLDSEAIYCNSFDDSAALIQSVHQRLVSGGAFWSRRFTPNTWGVETGQSIGRDYCLANTGPMAGKGPVRLTRLATIPELYGSDWSSINVGEITRRAGHPEQTIREWIIVARKPLTPR